LAQQQAHWLARLKIATESPEEKILGIFAAFLTGRASA
jgi:hypothetical protein